MKIYYGLFSCEAILKALSANKLINYGRSTFKVRILGVAILILNTSYWSLDLLAKIDLIAVVCLAIKYFILS